jgi:hypothetical protein
MCTVLLPLGGNPIAVKYIISLHRGKEEKITLYAIKRRKSNWISHILRRNCLLKDVTEEKIDTKILLTGRRERRCKQLLDDLKK